jgi:zinc transport system substrate-binding protein
MKRAVAITVCILLVLSLLPFIPSCAEKQGSGKIRILCTLFPQYDWIKNIVGDSDTFSVELLIKNGTDPHSYQPTAADVMAISNCDLIVYIGAESDKWVQEALERSKNTDIQKIALSSLEGMTLRNISSHSHSHGEDHDHGHEHGAFDEHLWLSLGNAKTAVSALTEEICALDGKNAESYLKNAKDYIAELDALEQDFKTAAELNDHPFVLFADRFPFVYLLSDCGIEYAAAFEGCTTDVDAGFDTVLGLIKEADTHGVKYIAVTETSDKSLAETVAASAKGDQQIIVLNSLQSVNAKQLSDKVSYLGVMRENLAALKKALG